MVKDVFGWLEEITVKKSPSSSFSEEDWKKWNTYLINKFLSQKLEYIDVVNQVQTIDFSKKELIYSIYRNLIPKKKVWLSLVKNQSSKISEDLIKNIAKYYQCSHSEAETYILILDKEEIKNILTRMAFESKEITKMLK